MVRVPAERHLDSVVADLFAPILAGEFDSAGWRLLSWDAEQGLCLTFERDDAYLLVELESRNDDLACYERTSRFNICVRHQFETDVPLSEKDRGFVDRLVEIVRQRESRLQQFERPTTGRRTAIREILVERVLIPEGRNHYYINPYVGCMIGCPFCYVRERADFSRRLEGLPEVAWGRYVDAKVNAAEVLRREVVGLPPGVVRMSPILTDPYQAVERNFRITRQCLEVLLGTELAPAVLTRAKRILADLDLIKRFERALVGFTIPTDDDRFRKIFEPGADPIEDRLEALRAFHAAGVPTIALLQPVLPLDVDRLVDLVAPYVRAVRIDRLYFPESVIQLYRENDLASYASEAYFSETVERLTEAFHTRGVKIDPMDDLQTLVQP